MIFKVPIGPYLAKNFPSESSVTVCGKFVLASVLILERTHDEQVGRLLISI
jgi:hypothetical protein